MKSIGNVLILGDSYSTFEGCVPNDCAVWYYKEIQSDTDVSDVKETWWHRLLDSTESYLVLNCSSSGTTFCHTGYSGSDCSKNTSFCARLRNLISDGFFKDIRVDTFIIFGGTNDSWAGSPLGEIMYGEKTEGDLFAVRPAFCRLLEMAKESCPEARVISVVNTELRPEIGELINEASEHYGTEVITLSNIEKQSGHPNKKGMTQICSQILEKL